MRIKTDREEAEPPTARAPSRPPVCLTEHAEESLEESVRSSVEDAMAILHVVARADVDRGEPLHADEVPRQYAGVA